MLHCIKSFGKIEKYSNDGFFIVKAMQNLAYCSIESMNGGVSFAKTVLFVINDFMLFQERVYTCVNQFFKSLEYGVFGEGSEIFVSRDSKFGWS